MSPKRIFRVCVPVVVLGAALLSSAAQASVLSGKLKELRKQAEIFERQADWDKACEIYEAILKINRDLPSIKGRYQHCLRRALQVHRHRDLSFRKEVLSLEYGQAMHLYEVVVDALLDNGLDKKKLKPAHVFRKGLEELHSALDSTEFCQAHLPGINPVEIREFQDLLKRTWASRGIASREAAKKQVREVAMAASALLQLNLTTVIMEFTCGACWALDEYTAYLTPAQLRELCDTLKGETGGVGLELASKDGKFTIVDVQMLGPAVEVMPSLLNHQLISIDKKPVDQMSVQTAQQALEGPAGTTVDLAVALPGMEPRTVTLRRRPMLLPSISASLLPGNVGYMQISCFHEVTLPELDLALSELAKAPMKALILDLRGNGGGLFETAIDAARRFLPQGVIASTQNYDAKYNTIYQSRNPAAMSLPLVVLVDGDTASAAEVLAGALKDNRRARLVGQTTFGKGCTQSVFKLPPAAGTPTGGLRITIARFFSPTGSPYAGRGVVPHILVERFTMLESMDPTDRQLEVARLEAQRLLENPR